MNKVFLIGNITKDLELSTTGNGVKFCRFTLAVSRNYTPKDKDARERETDFLPVVVWRAQAENCARFLKKGSRAAIVGSIQTRSYDDNTGNKRYVTEIVADEVQFLSTKGGDDGEKAEDIADLKPVDEDLPF